MFYYYDDNADHSSRRQYMQTILNLENIMTKGTV